MIHSCVLFCFSDSCSWVPCLWKRHYIRPSMVTHTWNLCSAINPSKVHTHSSEHAHTVNTHPEQWAVRGAVGGSVPCSRSPLSWYCGECGECGESAIYSLPPTTIPASLRLELPLGHEFPKSACCSPKKRIQVPQIIWFSQHFCVFEPFPTITVWFWDPSFHTEDNQGTQTLTDVQEKHVIKSRGWKLLNRMKMCLTNTALQKLQKILTCFPEDKISYIYSDIQIKKIYNLNKI